MSLTESLREAIRAYDGNVRSLSAQCGVTNPVLYRFLKGQRTITLETADTLAEFLGLELTPSKAVKPVASRSKPAKAAKAGTKSKSRPSPRPRSAAVARVRGFVDDYSVAQDVGARVNGLPRGHVKRLTIGRLLRWYRDDPALKAWRRKGTYR